MEKTNIRYVTQEEVPEEIAFSSIDVAFISLTKVLLPVKKLLCAGGRVVCLVKPQFEAGREKVGKKGVVRDKNVHLDVVCQIMTYAVGIGFEILALDFSPIKGPEGNIEYLLYLEKKEDDADLENTEQEEIYKEKYQRMATEVVENAHKKLSQ